MNNHSTRYHHRCRRLSLALAALAAGSLALLPAGAADAHVRVIPDNPTSGGFSALTFRVPNESETATTIEVRVELPTDTPLVYVSSKPVEGWTVTAPKEKLAKPYDNEGTTITRAVRTVTWTANEGTEIGPGEYQEFSLSVGPLPAPGTVVIPATQTYSDGTVVAWDQPTPPSGEEPEHPAPALELVAPATGSDHHASATPAAPDSGQHSSGDQTGADSGSDAVAGALGAVGLVAGVAALGVSVVALRRGSS